MKRKRSARILVVASALDTPTNLAVRGDQLLVSQGMGAPGRMVPTAQGPKPLEGFIDIVETAWAK